MDRLVDQMRRGLIEWREGVGDWPERPSVFPGRGIVSDLAEHDDEYVLTIDVSGFERDEIDLVVDDGSPAVSALHRDDDTPSLSRSISEQIALPKGIVEDDATASYRNDVLEVHLPSQPTPRSGTTVSTSSERPSSGRPPAAHPPRPGRTSRWTRSARYRRQRRVLPTSAGAAAPL